MKSDMICEELITLDLAVENSTEFFEQMSERLVAKGYVKETFLDAIRKREAEFPTALPIQPEAVAIPHTDASHIIRPFVAPARLKKPVRWCEMAANDVEHDVRFIFMLGIQKSGDHIELLQLLAENFQDPELMGQLDKAESEEAYMKILMTMKGLE